ncbi:MAG TPA: DsbA family protein [Gammaproteobacteria bacterium]|nr:DsbA family protein [Gammaproteobacteria bacterium]
MTPVLHYIYDPLCGWCYGAEPLAWAAASVDGLELEMHAGNLFPTPTRLPESTRRYIQQADARVAKMSGQPYGEAYLGGLLFDPALVLHSPPAIAAVLAAQSLDASKELAMLKAIQHAHYERGLHVIEPAVLDALAEEIGLDRAAFAGARGAVPVDDHVEQSQQLMGAVGAQGFPTFVLQNGNDWHPVPYSRFASSPAQFRDWLGAQVAALAPRH